MPMQSYLKKIKQSERYILIHHSYIFGKSIQNTTLKIEFRAFTLRIKNNDHTSGIQVEEGDRTANESTKHP